MILNLRFLGNAVFGEHVVLATSRLQERLSKSIGAVAVLLAITGVGVIGEPLTDHLSLLPGERSEGLLRLLAEPEPGKTEPKKNRPKQVAHWQRG